MDLIKPYTYDTNNDNNTIKPYYYLITPYENNRSYN